MENSNENRTNYNNLDNTNDLSVGEWFITILITMIPLVNIIMLLIWAFSSGTKPSKANWAKATLIWVVIGIILLFAFWNMVMAMFYSMNTYM